MEICSGTNAGIIDDGWLNGVGGGTDDGIGCAWCSWIWLRLRLST